MKTLVHLLITVLVAAAAAYGGFSYRDKQVQSELYEMAVRISKDEQGKNGGSFNQLRDEVKKEKGRADQLAAELQARTTAAMQQERKAESQLAQAKTEIQVLKAELESSKKPSASPAAVPVGMQRAR